MFWNFVLRLCLACVLGLAIGFERELHAKEAGVKTHLLVAMGSCLFMILSIYGFEGFYEKDHTSFDPSRIAAQVVTGIGFLGAGTIIFRKNIIRGLTTAAGLWVTCAIGLACGCGFYYIAMATTLLVIVSIFLSNVFLKKYSEVYTSVTFIAENHDMIEQLFAKLKKDNIQIKNYSIQQFSSEGVNKFTVNVDIKTQKRENKTEFSALRKEFSGFEITAIE
ncbi:MAG: MgtC/SapB family protein [Bacteroidales bacterium]|nr:MgtC/SapB family protein [Bacteroidales bacterium]